MSYSDGYTLETTFTFANEISGVNMLVGLCVQHEATGDMTCWSRKHEYILDDYWFDL